MHRPVIFVDNFENLNGNFSRDIQIIIAGLIRVSLKSSIFINSEVKKKLDKELLLRSVIYGGLVERGGKK